MPTGLVSLFNDISISKGYSMAKQSLENDSSGNLQIDNKGVNKFS